MHAASDQYGSGPGGVPATSGRSDVRSAGVLQDLGGFRVLSGFGLCLQVWDRAFGFEALGFGLWLRSSVQGLGFRVLGLGFWVLGSGFRVQGLGCCSVPAVCLAFSVWCLVEKGGMD